ncbi:hypothetical protein ACE41H_11185 [Paenibacillus enshidis]|uniref:Uncharacterized protein n=1 Tax=Paenibacillus enshidis TaxID=1458439 RepID=A0ABV5ATK1_9BACL
MKKTNKIASSLLAGSMAFILTAGGSAFASDDVHVLPTTPPAASSDGITIFGQDPPKSSASTHNLSISDYNYQVEKVGYEVFTDKWLTGVSSMTVRVDNWQVIKDVADGYNLSIVVHNSSGNVVTYKTIDPRKIGVAKFTGLSASNKYYVSFAVPNNGNLYKFNGSISK